jgi:hypothetical protein
MSMLASRLLVPSPLARTYELGLHACSAVSFVGKAPSQHLLGVIEYGRQQRSEQAAGRVLYIWHSCLVLPAC